MEGSALAGLETRITLINDVNTAFPAHHDTVFIACLSRFQGISDLHGLSSDCSSFKSAEIRGWAGQCQCPEGLKFGLAPPAGDLHWDGALFFRAQGRVLEPLDHIVTQQHPGTERRRAIGGELFTASS